MGADHENCPVKEFVVDRENRIVTTPAYMLAKRISEAAEGIDKLVKTVVELASETGMGDESSGMGRKTKNVERKMQN